MEQGIFKKPLFKLAVPILGLPRVAKRIAPRVRIVVA